MNERIFSRGTGGWWTVLVAVLSLWPATVAHATRYWKNSVVTGVWSNGNNWSQFSAANLDNGGAPGAGETANIVNNDGAARTVTLDVSTPSLGLLSIDLTNGSGATTNTLSIPNNFNLTAAVIAVGVTAGSGAAAGRGAINQMNGTVATNSGGDLIVGWNSGSTGTYTLGGSGTFTAAQSEYIGLNGTGTFNQTGGTNTAIGIYLGYNSLSSGTYNLSGTGTLSAPGAVVVGSSGIGVFNQSGGTSDPGDLYLGFSANSTGTYTLSSGSITTDDNEYVGYGGTGVFNHTGGTNTLTNRIGFLILGRVAGTGTYNLSGTGILSTINEYVGWGAAGFFNETGGSHTVSEDLVLGSINSPSVGTYTLSGGALLVGNREFIGHAGYGNFTQSGGTNTTGEFYLGTNPGSNGTYTLSGTGIASALVETVGASGAGTFNQSGGSNNTSGLILGSNLGSTGTYTLSGGSASASIVGVGDQGAGVLTVSGTGVLSVNLSEGGPGLIIVGNAAGNSLNLNGGTINTFGLVLNGAPASFNWTSGKLNFIGGVAWDSAAASNTTSAAFGAGRTLGANQTLMVSAEILGGAGGFSLTVNGGSLHQVTGSLTINPLGALTISGGTVTTASLVNNGGQFLFTSGTLNLTNQALAIAPGGVFGNTLDLAAGMTVNSTLGITNQGLVTGDGQLGGTFTNSATGELRAEPGRSLRLTGTGNTNAGRINLVGGELEFTQNLTNNVGGLVSGNGTLIAAGGITNSGVMNFGGTANILGDVTNAAGGRIISGGGGATIFFDDVANQGEIRTSTNGFTLFYGTVSGAGTFTGTGTVNFEGDLTPGNSPAAVQFAGNVGLGPSTTLEIELAGLAPGSQHDQLNVAGNLSLDGVLGVSLINGFTPAAGNSFNLLDWGSVSGTFSTLQLPSLAGGLTWNTSQLYTTGVLSVTSAGIPGDYNNNGTIDAGDYVVWRKYQGTTQTLPNDPAGGTIGAAQYTTWRSHFGQPPGSGTGAGTNAAVPEPSSSVLLMLAVAGWCLGCAGPNRKPSNSSTSGTGQQWTFVETRVSRCS